MAKTKAQGSMSFGTDIIKTDEAILLIKAMRADDPEMTPEEAMETIGFFDNCLSLLKIQSLHNNFRRTSKGNIQKNSSFRDMLSRRLDIHIDQLKEIRGVDSLFEDDKKSEI